MSIALQSAPKHSRKSSVPCRSSPFRVALAAWLLTLIAGYFWGRHLEQERRYAAWKNNNSIQVPAPSGALFTRIYPIPSAEPGRIHLDERHISELLLSHVEPDYWDEFGGQGHIDTLPG